MDTTKLQQKGWDDKEIKQAEAILKQSTHHDKFFAKIILWSALLVIVVGNILVSVVFIPFIQFFPSWVLYTLLVLLGLTIGFLYNFLITDIGHLESKHHIAASVVVPIAAFINFGLVFFAITQLYEKTAHNPILIAISYTVAFILPMIGRAIYIKSHTQSVSRQK